MNENEWNHTICVTHASCLPWGNLYCACNRVICKSHPCLHPVFGPAFTPVPWYPQSNEILLSLSMKCWNSGFNAQGSRLLIVIVWIVAVKIFCSSSGGAQEKGRNSVYYQNWWKTNFGSQLFRFVKFSFPVTRFMACYTETGSFRPLIARLDFTDNSNVWPKKIPQIYVGYNGYVRLLFGLKTIFPMKIKFIFLVT
jgi:hypothetical protein